MNFLLDKQKNKALFLYSLVSIPALYLAFYLSTISDLGLLIYPAVPFTVLLYRDKAKRKITGEALLMLTALLFTFFALALSGFRLLQFKTGIAEN